MDTVSYAKGTVQRLTSLRAALDPATRARTVEAILQPSSVFARSTETVELLNSRLIRTIRRQINPSTFRSGLRDKSADKVWFVPAMRHRKGEFTDNLEFWLNDVRVDALPHRDNVALTVLVTTELVEAAIRVDRKARNRLSSLAAAVVSNPAPMSKRAIYEELVSLLDTMLPPVNQRSVDQKSLVHFIDYFADYYVTYVPVQGISRPNTITTQFSEFRVRARTGQSNRVRRWLGIANNFYRIPIEEAFNSATYHFRCRAPADQYFNHGRCRVNAKATFAGMEAEEFSAAASQFSPTYGTDAVHFYSRGLRYPARFESQRSGVGPSHGLVLEIDFQPLPPGLSLPIVAVLAYLTVLVSTVAVLQNHVFGPGSDTLSHSTLGLVLASPALITAWIASKVDGQGIKNASPIALIEVASIIAISVLAVCVALVEGSGSLTGLKDHDFWVFRFRSPSREVSWALVWILAVGQFILSSIIARARVVRYGDALRRSEMRLHIATETE